METLKDMTPEIMEEIYSNEKLRNNVAYAHGCYTSFENGCKFKYFKTCSYPIAYKVTEDQIKEAKEEKERAKAELLTHLGNKLVFVGMGMSYEPRYEGDPCNHRIRTEIVNAHGQRFFIEVGTGRGDEMRVDHSINRTLQEVYKDDHHKQGEFYNYGNLERLGQYPKYTKENIIRLVNDTFGCKFNEMIVDDYNLTTDDYQSISPK
jgi:hypothetical protein